MLQLLASIRIPGRQAKCGRARVRWRLAVLAGVLVEIASIWFQSRRLGGSVVVRCRRGHLFTTIWIPAVSLKALRLGPWRFQRCPVGRHWSLVRPVDESTLSDQERQTAAAHKDIRLP